MSEQEPTGLNQISAGKVQGGPCCIFEGRCKLRPKTFEMGAGVLLMWLLY